MLSPCHLYFCINHFKIAQFHAIETGQHLIGQIKGKNTKQSTCKLLSTINNEQNSEADIHDFYKLPMWKWTIDGLMPFTMDHSRPDKLKMLFLSFVFVIFISYFQFSKIIGQTKKTNDRKYKLLLLLCEYSQSDLQNMHNHRWSSNMGNLVPQNNGKSTMCSIAYKAQQEITKVIHYWSFVKNLGAVSI